MTESSPSGIIFRYHVCVASFHLEHLHSLALFFLYDDNDIFKSTPPPFLLTELSLSEVCLMCPCYYTEMTHAWLDFFPILQSHLFSHGDQSTSRSPRLLWPPLLVFISLFFQPRCNLHPIKGAACKCTQLVSFDHDVHQIPHPTEKMTCLKEAILVTQAEQNSEGSLASPAFQGKRIL